jgi:aldose 1-epimerase
MPRPLTPSSTPFGFLPDGRAVHQWSLVGAGGLVLECLDYGGIVARLLVPDRQGQLTDVVLGCDTLDGYLAPQPFMGAIVGRVAGRITGARFNLDGRTYPLAANDAPNHLHGGPLGFDKQLWHADPVSRPDGAPSLRLSRLSPDGEEGYPGNVSVSVTYTVTADNSFLIESEAATDSPTPFSLTHHGYFNLSGHGSGTVENHLVQIHSDACAPTDVAGGLLGRRETVLPANDFRSPRRLGDALPGLFERHGDLYFLDPAAAPSVATPVPGRASALLVDPASGRILTVTTSESCLQLYAGAVFGRLPVTGKGGLRYPAHAGLCLECEGYPDAPNSPALGDITLRPGHPVRHTTVYAFSTL